MFGMMDLERSYELGVALFAAVFVMGTSVSCQADEAADATGASAETKAHSSAPVSQHEQTEGDRAEDGRMIVRSGRMSVAVADHGEAKNEASEIVRELEGYVASTSVYSTRADMEIRVPRDRFRKALVRFREMGEVLDESTSAEDVTRKHRDLEAELRNKRRLESRLRGLLESASSVEESLEIEEKLSTVRSEIEKLESRVQGLEHDVAMSRISLVLHGPSSSAVGRFMTPIYDAVSDVSTIASTVLGGLIRLLAALVPLAIIGGLGLYGMYLVARWWGGRRDVADRE